MSTTPRWLNADERRAWLAYVDFSTLLADHLNRQLRRDAGMTHADYSVLAYLSMAPDSTLGMSELAERLKITRSRLTHAVNRLREVGLVDRREDPADGRGQLAFLTGEGKALLEKVAPGHVEAVRRVVFDVLTPEQVRQFAEIGEAISQALHRAESTHANPTVLPWRRR
ncbi:MULTISPECIES: MarR family winged helix-turn-helix transcriptional regulator [unclassified Streptomyces]|jgi:DNA-binding MarR family transcriptional regulator|uniref:MarR family winged helix-turn-helix transcriptional regulator n=1 Tax=unclassified Streptomyces TaxID=2593676 RepID=UPI0029A30002|nr:MarR family winged helix-turn-helix transcriptional regulator [Streptomyces sp. ME18-1-4]MDX3248933.1 MarR family winged helix-turn-helix transcriptional regulator [Streptomyces sp. ME18-1-4]